MQNAHIRIQNISIAYPVRYPDSENIRSQLIKLFTRTGNKKETLYALNNLSLEISEGERVGLVGTNGSGKTTLLKVLSNILYPVSGNLTISGKVHSILDPGLGMDPEASGIENIRIRCMLLGHYKNIEQKIQEISEFSELGDAIRRPIKTYSSGMAMRLTFSIATAIAPDILVMDEWLSAGDAGFVSKALNKMQNLIQKSKILVIASHSETVLTEWCTRVIWMKDGEIVADGKPKEILARYHSHATAPAKLVENLETELS